MRRIAMGSLFIPFSCEVAEKNRLSYFASFFGPNTFFSARYLFSMAAGDKFSSFFAANGLAATTT
jgi:hypothetical protein